MSKVLLVGFIGLVALGLAGLGIWAGPARLGWMRRWAVVLPLFGIVMALGNQNGLYRLIAANLVQGHRSEAAWLIASLPDSELILYDAGHMAFGFTGCQSSSFPCDQRLCPPGMRLSLMNPFFRSFGSSSSTCRRTAAFIPEQCPTKSSSPSLS